MWRAAVRPAKPAPTITTFAFGIFFGCSFIGIYYRDSQNGCSDENFSRGTDRDSLRLESPEPSGSDRLPPLLRLGSDRHRISVSGIRALGATAGDPEPLGRYGDGHDSGPRAGRPRIAGAARPSIAEDVRRQRGAGDQFCDGRFSCGHGALGWRPGSGESDLAQHSPDVAVLGLGADPGIHTAVVFLHALRRDVWWDGGGLGRGDVVCRCPPAQSHLDHLHAGWRVVFLRDVPALPQYLSHRYCPRGA